MTESRAMPTVPELISAYLADPTSANAPSFDELALAAFRFQFDHVAPYRTLCERRGATPETVTSWRDVPKVPTSAFKVLDLSAAPPEVSFRSSGTGGERSVHGHPFLDLYRRAIEASFPRFALPAPAPLPILSLVPTAADLPDSSLSFMIDHVLARWGDPSKSVCAVGPRGVDAVAARSWTGARQREGRPVLVIATALALDQWLAALARQELKFRLPAGSAIFETGGFKGKEREVTREELIDGVELRFHLPRTRIVREYGMTELTSQCYGSALSGGDPDLFTAPEWVRVTVVDPETLTEAPHGQPGLLAIFDLANVGSAVHVLTEDLGVAEIRDGQQGFRLVGRAAGAELRGCSLAAEELARGAR